MQKHRQQRQISYSTNLRCKNILDLYLSISLPTKIIKISLLSKNRYSFHIYENVKQEVSKHEHFLPDAVTWNTIKCTISWSKTWPAGLKMLTRIFNLAQSNFNVSNKLILHYNSNNFKFPTVRSLQTSWSFNRVVIVFYFITSVLINHKTVVFSRNVPGTITSLTSVVIERQVTVQCTKVVTISSPIMTLYKHYRSPDFFVLKFKS